MVAPTGDDVKTLVEHFDEARDVGRIVLKIAVDRHDHIAARVVEPRHHRRGLADVVAQMDDADALVPLRQLGCQRSGPVPAAVIDEQQLAVVPEIVEHGKQLVEEGSQVLLLVVERNHDRHIVPRWA